MPQQRLYGSNIGARLQQVGGKAVTQGMHGHGFENACLGHGHLQGALQTLFEQMVPALDAAARVNRKRR